MKKSARPVVTPEPPDPADPRGLALPIMLILLALAAAFALWRMQPPAPKPASAPAEEFSAGRAEVILRDLLGPGEPSHPSGGAENAALRARLVAQLKALGYEAEVQAASLIKRDTGASAFAAYPQNVLARLPGRESGRAA